MKLQQLSVFLENKPGQMAGACQALGQAGINIATMSLADALQFGIMRLIVGDAQRAKTVLEEARYVVKLTDVVPIAVPHRPGGLAGVLEKVGQAGVNVEYMYALPCIKAGEVVVIFRFEDPDATISALSKAGVRVLDGPQVLAELEG